MRVTRLPVDGGFRTPIPGGVAVRGGFHSPSREAAGAASVLNQHPEFTGTDRVLPGAVAGEEIARGPVLIFGVQSQESTGKL